VFLVVLNFILQYHQVATFLQQIFKLPYPEPDESSPTLMHYLFRSILKLSSYLFPTFLTSFFSDQSFLYISHLQHGCYFYRPCPFSSTHFYFKLAILIRNTDIDAMCFLSCWNYVIKLTSNDPLITLADFELCSSCWDTCVRHSAESISTH
jgi:hypothetical protein